jgi:hypothetical protein
MVVYSEGHSSDFLPNDDVTLPVIRKWRAEEPLLPRLWLSAQQWQAEQSEHQTEVHSRSVQASVLHQCFELPFRRPWAC